MTQVRFALFLTLLLVPVACGDKDESDDSASTGGMGGDSQGKGGSDDEKMCFFNCEENSGTGGNDGSGGTEAVDPEFLNKGSLDYCSFDGIETKGVADKSLVLTNFDSGEDEYKTENGLWGKFWASNDGKGTTNVSDTGEQEWLRGTPGREGSNYALHMVGSGFSSWGAGVNSSVVYHREDQKNCLYDASAFDGISFWVRGEATGNMEFLMQLPGIAPASRGGSCDEDTETCWDAHRVSFPVTSCWTQQVIAWDDLAQLGFGKKVDFDPAFLRSIEWTFPAGVDFDVYIDDAEFFVGEAPAPGPEGECLSDGIGGAGGMGAQ